MVVGALSIHVVTYLLRPAAAAGLIEAQSDPPYLDEIKYDLYYYSDHAHEVAHADGALREARNR